MSQFQCFDADFFDFHRKTLKLPAPMEIVSRVKKYVDLFSPIEDRLAIFAAIVDDLDALLELDRANAPATQEEIYEIDEEFEEEAPRTPSPPPIRVLVPPVVRPKAKRARAVTPNPTE